MEHRRNEAKRTKGEDLKTVVVVLGITSVLMFAYSHYIVLSRFQSNHPGQLFSALLALAPYPGTLVFLISDALYCVAFPLSSSMGKFREVLLLAAAVLGGYALLEGLLILLWGESDGPNDVITFGSHLHIGSLVFACAAILAEYGRRRAIDKATSGLN